MQQDSPKTTAKLVSSAFRQYQLPLEFISPCGVPAGAGLPISALTREDVAQPAPTCEHTTNATFLPCLIHSPIVLYLATRFEFLNSKHLGLRSFNPDISGLCVLVKSYNLALTYLLTNVKLLCLKGQELLQRKRRWVSVLENLYEFPN